MKPLTLFIFLNVCATISTVSRDTSEENMRQSGILLHISSLPGPYGIGSFGAGAYQFIDFLKKSKQSYWQILPLGPTSYGDSPYQTFSGNALNHYFIDLDFLIKEGLLTKKDIITHKPNPKDINYGALYQDRLPILKKAFIHFEKNKAYTRFMNQHASWLDDYALFMSLKTFFSGQSFNRWPEDIKMRYDYAVTYYCDLLKEDIEFHKFIQFKAYQQWLNLKSYANKKGIQIIGDIPIYLAYDSTEVWTQPQVFQLNQEREMTHVAGVPPDGFSEDGQLWGNPLYNWDHLKETNYDFWVTRMALQSKLYDMIRIDHFIGFEHYYSIPATEKTARNGQWLNGPSYALFEAIKARLGQLNIIAEDLGRMTQGVIELLKNTGFPGMKLTQFALFDEGNNASLPHGFSKNSIAYTGTHDNETTKSWFKHLDTNTKRHVLRYTNTGSRESVTYGLIKETLKCPSKIAIIPFQDYLELGDAGRMNEPSTIGKNWRYRTLHKDFTIQLQRKIAMLTKLYGRHKEQRDDVYIES